MANGSAWRPLLPRKRRPPGRERDAAPNATGPHSDPQPGREGLELIGRYECNRCHAIDGVDPPDAHADCVGCHRDITRGTFDAPADALADWRPRVEPLSQTPSLRHVGERLRRDWIAEFLAHPHDVRPALVQTMPRLDIGAREARSIAIYLAPSVGEPAGFDAADIPQGRALYVERGCAGCHAFGGSGIAATASHPLAPDLRFARDRVRLDRLVAWIRDPAALDPDASMPAADLTEPEARAVAAFLVLAAREPAPARELPERLPVLDRTVSFAEVQARVFRRVCWHCHSDPDFGLGDGGPGNDGGFGFVGRHLDLSSYEGILSGGTDASGDAVSIFRLGEAGVPRLVETLLARQREEAGEEVEGVRGMPLGMPSVSAEDVQLVETWIAQGRSM